MLGPDGMPLEKEQKPEHVEPHKRPIAKRRMQATAMRDLSISDFINRAEPIITYSVMRTLIRQLRN